MKASRNKLSRHAVYLTEDQMAQITFMAETSKFDLTPQQVARFLVASALADLEETTRGTATNESR